jgi:hypothetical protein
MQKMAIVLSAMVASVAFAGDYFVKVIEKRTNDNTRVVMDGVFGQPKVLDSIYVFVPETEAAGAFTNLCTVRYALSTNVLGTTVGSSSQSVHFVAMTNIDLKVYEGDVISISNSMLRTTTRMFFK